MSCNYADGLSAYENKGILGRPEKFDTSSEVEAKVNELAKLVKNARHIVVHTGAGISTSAGIPDFRGPKGVWTLEKKGEKPNINISWDDARPTVTHMALAKLVEMDKVKFIVSQNIDGLHLRSGVPRNKISELHGNMFVDLCDKCLMMFVRDSAASTVGQISLGAKCINKRDGGRACRGKLHDFVLDWEHALPDDDLQLSESHSMMADLSIVLGSTLQIVPSGKLPTYSKKYQEDGKLVICNLQPTKYDKQAVLTIHTYVDDVMKGLMNKLGWEIPDFDPEKDPIRQMRRGDVPEVGFFDWTASSEDAKMMKKKSDKIASDLTKRKKEREKERQEKEKWKRKSEKVYGSVLDLNDSKRVKLEDEEDDIKVCKIISKAPSQLTNVKEESKVETKRSYSESSDDSSSNKLKVCKVEKKPPPQFRKKESEVNDDSSDDDVLIVQEQGPIKFLSTVSDDDDKDVKKLNDSRAVNGKTETPAEIPRNGKLSTSEMVVRSLHGGQASNHHDDDEGEDGGKASNHHYDDARGLHVGQASDQHDDDLQNSTSETQDKPMVDRFSSSEMSPLQKLANSGVTVTENIAF